MITNTNTQIDEKAKEEDLVDQLILDGSGISVCLLKVEVGTAEGDEAMLEAWFDDGTEDLLGGHGCEIRWAMKSHQDIYSSSAIGHND